MVLSFLNFFVPLLALAAALLLIYGLIKKDRVKRSIGILLLAAALIGAINLPWPLTTIIGVDPSSVTVCSAYKVGGSGGVPALSDEETALLLETLEGHYARLTASGNSLSLPAGTLENPEYWISFYSGNRVSTIRVFGNGVLIKGDRLYTLTQTPEYSILDFLGEHALFFQ